MCTVSYFYKGEDRFILSSNRDETPLRADNELVIENIEGQEIIYPRDVKGGSWIFAAENRLVCLLNGAWKKHKHRPPYKISRGLMLKAYMEYNNLSDFLTHYDLDGIEPFTVVIREYDNLYELRWDERDKYVQRLDIKANYVWSSCTLYTPEWQKKRAQWFEAFLEKTPDPELEDIRDLHRNTGKENPTQAYVMNRLNLVKTVSITHINYNKKNVAVEFNNLENQTLQRQEMSRQLANSNI